jgi:hypothetical protein
LNEKKTKSLNANIKKVSYGRSNLSIFNMTVEKKVNSYIKWKRECVVAEIIKVKKSMNEAWTIMNKRTTNAKKNMKNKGSTLLVCVSR